MAKKKLTFPHRRKYRVTLTLDDGTEPQFTVWAETSEHAIRKAGKKNKPDSQVVSQMAEEIKT